MNNQLHPSKDEIQYINLAYNRFFDLFKEIMKDEFWVKEPCLRLHRTQEIFLIYTELLKYPPILWTIEQNKRPNFSDVGKDLFTLVRNVMVHFPFFNEWNDIWFSKPLVNLYSKKPQFIDKYLTRNEGNEPLKYRIWEKDKKRMTYISVCFPSVYSIGNKIYLKDILSERDGIKFSAVFMIDILKVQIEEIKET